MRLLLRQSINILILLNHKVWVSECSVDVILSKDALETWTAPTITEIDPSKAN